MKLAEQVGIDRLGLIIEGKRLPYYLAEGPVEVEVNDEFPVARVTVTLLADSVDIDPLLEVETDGNVRLVNLPAETKELRDE